MVYSDAVRQQLNSEPLGQQVVSTHVFAEVAPNQKKRLTLARR